MNVYLNILFNVSPDVCPKCGWKTADEKFYAACGYNVDLNIKNCRECSGQMYVNARFCPVCGAEAIYKNAFVAFILSFIFPGLGQLYNNQNHKAIVLIIGT